MKIDSSKSAFTLVEILVAMALIVTIVSMVYGSYFATSRSTDAAGAAVTSAEQARRILNQIAQQIRCCYVNRAACTPSDNISVVGAAQRGPTCFFNGRGANSSGEVLHLVTTKAASVGQDSPAGLFEVVYKFDKSNGVLLLSQHRFVPTVDSPVRRRTFRAVAENIDAIDLAFFDGQNWTDNWRLEEKGELPRAVRIQVIFQDRKGREHRWGITALTGCRTGMEGKSTGNPKISGRGS